MFLEECSTDTSSQIAKFNKVVMYLSLALHVLINILESISERMLAQLA